MKKLNIIIPCYYNQDNVEVTFNKLKSVLDGAGLGFQVIFVDDGSKDQTYQRLVQLREKYGQIKVVKLLKNVGSYTAILAGLEHAADGDCYTVISADLQDPPELILQMFKEWEKGTKLVIGQRTKRQDGFLTDLPANVFNHLIRRYSDNPIPKGGFDFVFFDRELRDRLVQMNERNTNTLYLLTWMGYPYTCIPYERREREIGKSRWTLAKKLKLFIDSFISYTYLPIRMISLLGLVLGGCSFAYMLVIFVMRLLGMITVEGWPALMTVILLVSSFQMIALGVIGEYVWRCLDGVRGRPQYFIERIHE